MIKQSQVFGWDEEPVDERPSEFIAGHSTLSGYLPITNPRVARRSSGSSEWKALLVFCGVMLASGAFAMVNLAPLLRG